MWSDRRAAAVVRPQFDVLVSQWNERRAALRRPALTTSTTVEIKKAADEGFASDHRFGALYQISLTTSNRFDGKTSSLLALTIYPSDAAFHLKGLNRILRAALGGRRRWKYSNGLSGASRFTCGEIEPLRSKAVSVGAQERPAD